MAIWDEISYVTVFFKAFLTPLVPLSIDFNGRKNEIFGFREDAKNTMRGDVKVGERGVGPSLVPIFGISYRNRYFFKNRTDLYR